VLRYSVFVHNFNEFKPRFGNKGEITKLLLTSVNDMQIISE
jgi:hypothetical protein